MSTCCSLQGKRAVCPQSGHEPLGVVLFVPLHVVSSHLLCLETDCLRYPASEKVRHPMITFTVYPHPLACIAIGGLHHHSLACIATHRLYRRPALPPGGTVVVDQPIDSVSDPVFCVAGIGDTETYREKCVIFGLTTPIISSMTLLWVEI